MPEITRQRQGEMVRKTFEILLAHPEGLPAKQVLAAAADQLTLSPFEASDYPNHPGVRRFEKIVRFSTIPFVKAGWLAKTKGTWAVTDEGRAAYETNQDPAEFMRAAVALYQEWKRARPVEPTDEGSADISEEAEEEIAAAATFEEAEEAAWADISAHLRAMSPYEFQDLVAALLEAMGYHVAWVAPPGPDRGIDIIVGLDPLGIKDPRIKVQVKHRPDARTASDQLRSFMAVLSDKDVGIFVASGGFTRDAETEARTQETRRITLIDLERLVELWIEHYGEIPDTQRQLLPLRPVHYLNVATQWLVVAGSATGSTPQCQPAEVPRRCFRRGPRCLRMSRPVSSPTGLSAACRRQSRKRSCRRRQDLRTGQTRQEVPRPWRRRTPLRTVASARAPRPRGDSFSQTTNKFVSFAFADYACSEKRIDVVTSIGSGRAYSFAVTLSRSASPVPDLSARS